MSLDFGPVRPATLGSLYQNAQDKLTNARGSFFELEQYAGFDKENPVLQSIYKLASNTDHALEAQLDLIRELAVQSGKNLDVSA